ncbi:MAG: type II toxin-antitoxin system RelE/ParE family toxin [Glaciecola sp.]|jgi:mRNA interferase RelE/StbE|nr:type II toxin-antitoxin system RelE/ParE family toxin [Glaciecola sp.]MDG1815503.1 type II toxin-antitoxin system RelE/ParE family toxin [Glaciecola sp.]MDG2099783.1 type II toxin-antitoxin system RelE/ParE family toxin [Glaciecola sp.]
MVKYSLSFKKSVTKDFRSIPKKDVSKILEKINTLRENPYIEGSIILTGRDVYRIRHGLYRIIYIIRNDQLVIHVIKVGHRSDVYKYN